MVNVGPLTAEIGWRAEFNPCLLHYAAPWFDPSAAFASEISAQWRPQRWSGDEAKGTTSDVQSIFIDLSSNTTYRVGLRSHAHLRAEYTASMLLFAATAFKIDQGIYQRVLTNFIRM